MAKLIKGFLVTSQAQGLIPYLPATVVVATTAFS